MNQLKCFFVLLVSLFHLSSTAAYVLGIERFDDYQQHLIGKKIGMITNHTSRINGKLSIDYFLEQKLNVTLQFALEHGVDGKIENGAVVYDVHNTDHQIPIISLYQPGSKTINLNHLAQIDLLVFDVQDVGVRFYTYISSLFNIIAASIESQKELIIFDRPNPFLNLVQGPVLKPKYKSFVGKIELPIVYGMTIGELAKFIIGEYHHGKAHKITIVDMANFKRNDEFIFDHKNPPSPNLNSLAAIKLYPTLGLLEGTNISVARGTPHPFLAIGHPNPSFFAGEAQIKFTPQSIPEMSLNPPHLQQECYGLNLESRNNSGFNYALLKEIYDEFHQTPKTSSFFLASSNMFDLLAGDRSLRQALTNQWSPQAFTSALKQELTNFESKRLKYLNPAYQNN
jgi:uncharacterized protein YbbC (DUF1343 family)